MSGYPRINESGETVWACCESSIGQPCAHRRLPAPAVDIVSNWGPDACWDPIHRKATIRVNGDFYVAHRTLGEGWPFTVRPARYDGRSWTVTSFAEFTARLAG